MESPPIQSHCIRQTALPGASALFTDLLYHPERVKAFFPHAVGDLDAAAALASTLNYPDERRAALVESLRPLNGKHPSLDRLAQPERDAELEVLDDALNRLAQSQLQVAELVQLRYFVGLTIPAAAEILGISPRTADAWWSYARGWLAEDLKKS